VLVNAESRFGRWVPWGNDLRLSLGLGLVALLAAWAPIVAVAQTYKSVPKAITDQREVRTLRRDVSTILRGGAALSAEDRKKLQAFYVMHVIAGMTQPASSVSPSQFPDWRKMVVADLDSLRSPQAQTTHSFIRDDLIFKYAQLLVTDRAYSPAARYNALLLIGELNDRESQGSSGSTTPAQPMARARPYLLGVLNSDDTQEMKVGALIGLARHARLIAAAGRVPDENLLGAFVDVLKKTEPAGDGTADGLMWMHCVAINALGDIGHQGAAPLLQPIVNDASASMMLRCAAAEALGRLDYRNAADFDAAAAVKGLGELATQALGDQLAALQQHLISNPIEPGRETRAGDPPEKQPEDPYVQRVRRQLKYQLGCASDGLVALEKAAADANAKNAATAVRSAIVAVLKELDSESMTPQSLFDKIGRPAEQLENAVESL
jgi:hypothetical protein